MTPNQETVDREIMILNHFWFLPWFKERSMLLKQLRTLIGGRIYKVVIRKKSMRFILLFLSLK